MIEYDVRRELEKIPMPTHINKLEVLPQKTDALVKRLCKELSIKYASYLFSVVEESSENDDFIKDALGRIYCVNIHSVLKTDILCLHVSPFRESIDTLLKGEKCLTVAIDALGKYRLLDVSISKHLKPRRDYLTAMYRCIFETSYRWLEYVIIKYIINHNEYIANKLRNYLQSVFANNKLISRFQFGIVSMDYVFRLLDGASVMTAFNVMSKNAYWYQSSPCELTAEVARTVVAAKKTISQSVIFEDIARIGDLKDVGYNGTNFWVGIRALYETTLFGLYPVYKSGFTIDVH